MKHLEEQHECETCNGKGVAMFSCCTGEVVDEDMGLCPSCYEHLGEDTCEDCNGTGISTGHESCGRAEDLILKAEIYYDNKKYE
jgi:hypothetical protein